MEYIHIVYTWFMVHPQLLGYALLVLYTYMNVMKREPPPKGTPLYICWLVIEWFTFLNYDKWIGGLKLPFAPPKPQQPPTLADLTKTEEKKDEVK